MSTYRGSVSDYTATGTVLRRRAQQATVTAASPGPGRWFPEPTCVRFVLPAFNEAACIGDLLARVGQVMAGRRFRVYVVDDGSSDGTADIVLAAARSLPVTLVRNEVNLGLGGALSNGLRRAVADSGPDDVVLTMDADLTHDPVFVEAMVAAYTKGNDLVIASRFRRGARVVGVSAYRRFLTLGARLFYGSLVPAPGVRDYSCGFRLYRAELLREAFDRFGSGFIAEQGFACMVEILAKLRRAATIAEVPFTLRYDEKRTPSAMKIPSTIRAYGRVIRRAWRAELSANLGREAGVARMAWPALASVILLSVAGQVLLKHGAVGAFGGEFSGGPAGLGYALLEPALLAGVVCYALSAMLWLLVLTQLNLSVAYPVGALSYLVVIAAAASMGEHVPLLRWVGVCSIVVGIAVVGLGFERRSEE